MINRREHTRSVRLYVPFDLINLIPFKTVYCLYASRHPPSVTSWTFHRWFILKNKLKLFHLKHFIHLCTSWVYAQPQLLFKVDWVLIAMMEVNFLLRLVLERRGENIMFVNQSQLNILGTLLYIYILLLRNHHRTMVFL